MGEGRSVKHDIMEVPTPKAIDEITMQWANRILAGINKSDDQQTKGQLLDGAIAYIDDDVSCWPWEPDNFQTTDKVGIRGQLIRAAALIVAEIERLDRASPKG